MYNTLRRDCMAKFVFLLLLLICLLSGCGGVDVNLKSEKEETEQYIIDVKTAQIKGLSDEIFQEKINNDFMSANENLIKSFKERFSANDNKVDSLKSEPIIYYGKNTISIVNNIREFTGGAYEILSRKTVVIDLNRSEELTLSDLFVDDKWRDFINRKLSEIADNDSEKYSVLWEKPVIMSDQGFYINGASLVIYYPPYELSYYARGFVDFSIPLSELEGYIKSDYYEN